MPRNALLALALVALGCGENKRDVFMQGLEIEGAAEKGPCRLHYAENAQAAALSGDMVDQCLRETDKAIALYDRAAALGLKDPEFLETHARAKERKARLEQMLRMVRSMETEQLIQGK